MPKCPYFVKIEFFKLINICEGHDMHEQILPVQNEWHFWMMCQQVCVENRPEAEIRLDCESYTQPSRKICYCTIFLNSD